LAVTFEGEMQFLSDEWLAAADEALSDLRPIAAELVVGFRVTGGPAGESAHRLVLGPQRVGARRGTGGAALTLTMSWDLAIAISRGESSAQRAFLDGRLQLSGDPAVLLGHQQQLAEIDDRLAGLRDRTSYR
jgi:hypothetical protein